MPRTEERETSESADRTDAPLNRSAEADGYNAGYADRLYERALRERGVVPPSLADWSVDGERAERTPTRATPPAEAVERAARLRSAAIAGALVQAFREHGHLAVQLDPLGSPPPGHPALETEFYGVGRSELETLPAESVGLERLGRTVGDVLGRLEEIYCRRIGYELDHVERPDQREWLVEYIESGRHWEPLDETAALALLERLTEVEGLERFLHRSYLGKKRFSIEGLDMMVPLLDEALRRAASAGVRAVYLGMAHRGRLNVLAHVVGREYEQIVAEFEGMMDRGVQTSVPPGGAGDVKYHIGARGTFRSRGTELPITLAPNPSHLEHVNPVVGGMARAARDLEGDDRTSVLPVLIHGDAAFMGQGVVAETLNLSRLVGYETGGTLHLIANNQLGFTTAPEAGRSTRYASDLALGFRIPVLHVNADDPEACLAAARLAVDYRAQFAEDLVIDLVGYRRYGHNEGDEPGYTQPAMYAQIEEHPSVRALWARRLVEAGTVSEEDADGLADAVAERLTGARERLQAKTEEAAQRGGPAESGTGWAGTPLTGSDDEPELPATAVAEDRLRSLNAGLHDLPEDFRPYKKLGRQLDRRAASLDEGLDWAHAEALAFASLVTDGVRVRLTGEDTERGTFSQRHLVLHDADGRGTRVPLRHLSEEQAPFEIFNSPLSEVAALGFEYGYSTVALEGLVLWEAQFGDFVNVGQAIVDQFIAAGRSKWGQESRLTLLLPHGYEGQGPEHSSARLERFLQLAAEDNLRVANCSTPAQYFHLLRVQALRPARRPLVVMTPKSLLRHPRARSSLAELSQGGFSAVLPDPGARERADRIQRAVLCSGKVYYDLTGSEAGEEAERTAVIRLERLYPFPRSELAEILSAFPALGEVRWVQEEPANMGAWSFVGPRLRDMLGPERNVAYVGRPAMASSAEGYPAAHQTRQEEIIRKAFAGDS